MTTQIEVWDHTDMNTQLHDLRRAAQIPTIGPREPLSTADLWVSAMLDARPPWRNYRHRARPAWLRPKGQQCWVALEGRSLDFEPHAFDHGVVYSCRCDIILRFVLPFVFLLSIVSVMLRLCCVMFRVMLCYVMLRHIMLCHVMCHVLAPKFMSCHVY